MGHSDVLCAYVFATVHLTRLRRLRRSAYPLASACCGCPRRTKDLRNHPTADYKSGRLFSKCQRFCRTWCSTIESVEAVQKGGPAEAQQSGFGGERRSSGATELLPLKAKRRMWSLRRRGTPFFHIFRRATKDMATGGRRLITALRKNVITEKRKSPAAVPRVGLFPFSCSHHTTFPFHCLPLFFHFAEIFKKICRKTAPAPPKFRTAPT